MASIAENGNNRDTVGSKSMEHGKLTSKGMERSLPSSMPVLDRPGFPACDLGKSTSICNLYEGKYLD